MGQRLNIEIKNNKETLANCYYHWSGFTTSSLELTKIIIEYLKNNNVSKDVNGAIELLKSTGADFKKDRNSGLIGISEKEIEETRSWEEGRIEINLNDNTFNFKCAFENNYTDDEEIWKLISHLFYKIDIKSKSNISFDKIDELLNGVKISENNYKGRFCFEYSAFNSIF